MRASCRLLMEGAWSAGRAGWRPSAWHAGELQASDGASMECRLAAGRPSAWHAGELQASDGARMEWQAGGWRPSAWHAGELQASDGARMECRRAAAARQLGTRASCRRLMERAWSAGGRLAAVSLACGRLQ
ncbi:hypothetical protein HYH03_000001, partial [Edaphochlamys debaryana]